MKPFLIIILSLLFCSELTSQCDSLFTVDFAVYNSKTGEPIHGFKMKVSGTDGSEVNAIIENDYSHSFKLLSGYDYSFTLESKTFYSLSHTLKTKKNCYSEDYIQQLEFYLEPIMIVCSWTIPTVPFEFNSHEITSSNQDSLQYIYELLKNNPSLVMKLKGLVTSDEYKILSCQRATVVKNWLIAKGISKDRLEIWFDSNELDAIMAKKIEKFSKIEIENLRSVHFYITRWDFPE